MQILLSSPCAYLPTFLLLFIEITTTLVFDLILLYTVVLDSLLSYSDPIHSEEHVSFSNHRKFNQKSHRAIFLLPIRFCKVRLLFSLAVVSWSSINWVLLLCLIQFVSFYHLNVVKLLLWLLANVRLCPLFLWDAYTIQNLSAFSTTILQVHFDLNSLHPINQVITMLRVLLIKFVSLLLPIFFRKAPFSSDLTLSHYTFAWVFLGPSPKDIPRKLL